ncbi:hypothetical protein RCL1_008535 [Eukaryota sp. TZLM3-RCL]
MLFTVITFLFSLLLILWSRFNPFRSILSKLHKLRSIPPNSVCLEVLKRLEKTLISRKLTPFLREDSNILSLDNNDFFTSTLTLLELPQTNVYTTALHYYTILLSSLNSTKDDISTKMAPFSSYAVDPSLIPAHVQELLIRVHHKWFKIIPDDVYSSKLWLEMGFQQSNPCTDFRGLGLLPAFVLDLMGDLPVAKNLYHHSIKFDWPFAQAVLTFSRDCYELIEVPTSAVRGRLLQMQEFEGFVRAVLDLMSAFAVEWQKKEKRIIFDWNNVWSVVKKNAVHGKEFGCSIKYFS